MGEEEFFKDFDLRSLFDNRDPLIGEFFNQYLHDTKYLWNDTSLIIDWRVKQWEDPITGLNNKTYMKSIKFWDRHDEV